LAEVSRHVRRPAESRTRLPAVVILAIGAALVVWLGASLSKDLMPDVEVEHDGEREEGPDKDQDGLVRGLGPALPFARRATDLLMRVDVSGSGVRTRVFRPPSA